MSVIPNGPAVAIIGGGISGLVCANRLAQIGITNTTVFDTGKHAPGGRCSSRHVMINGQQCTFDHSAQYFTVSDSRFAKIVSYLHRKDAIRVLNGKIGHLKGGDFTEDKNLTQAFVGVNGMGEVPKCLASNVNVKTATWVGYVKWEESARKWKVDRYGFYDFLVIAHNGKCADKLMANSSADKIHKLTQVRFGDRLNTRDRRMQLCSIWALLVAFPTSLKMKFVGAHTEDVEISWIANNTAKLSDPKSKASTPSMPECWTVLSTRQFGSRNKCPQENIPPKAEREVTEKMLLALKRVTGFRELPTPCYTRVQLWGAAVPMNILKGGEECVYDRQHNVGICGDWLTSPSIQGAAVSGLALAEKIGQHVKGQERLSTSMEPEFIPSQGECIGAFPTNPDMVFKPNT